LKAELGIKAKKEKENETNDTFCSLKVPIDHDDKESKTYTMTVKIYDSGSPEEFLKWPSYVGGTSQEQRLYR
jgi:hypothetical protein